MVITEREASTIDESQLANFTEIQHPGYCYFPFQVNPQIAAQSGTIYRANKTPEDYVRFINDETGGAISFIAPYSKPVKPSTFTTKCLYDQINLLWYNYYILHTLNQAYSLNDLFYNAPTDTLPLTKEHTHIERILLNLFKSYGHEEFDSDIAFYFTNDLEILIRKHGKPAITAIGNIISKEIPNHDLINEILKAVGRAKDIPTNNTRFELLTSYLKNVSVTIRDGAVSGLSFLDDKRALPQLRILYERETAPIFKGNIKVAIENLEL